MARRTARAGGNRAGSSRAGRKPKPSDIWPATRRPWLAFWRDHARIGRESLTFVSHALTSTLLVWLLIGFALALPAGLYLVDLNLANTAGQWRGDAGLSVYFRPRADAETWSSVAQRLERERGIESVRLITPEEALAEFRQRAGLADVLGDLDDNPLPATIRASAAADVAVARLDALARRIRRQQAVDEVVVERAWLRRLDTIREVLQRFSWMAAALVGLGAILVSSASVRLAIEARLAELQVQVLVGAKKSFMRRPFLYLGAIYGIGGALVAAMLIAAMLTWLETPLTRFFDSYGGHLELIGFDPIFILVLLVSGVTLGMAGAVVASNRRLKRLTLM